MGMGDGQHNFLSRASLHKTNAVVDRIELPRGVSDLTVEYSLGFIGNFRLADCAVMADAGRRLKRREEPSLSGKDPLVGHYSLAE